MCPEGPEAAAHRGFLLLSCEHGGREVPPAYEHLFRGADDLLASHRGWDIGALGVALRMASGVPAPLVFTTVTRLLVDANRSLGHPELLSRFTRDLPRPDRDRIVREHHAPHRSTVTRLVQAAIAAGHEVLHVSVHSCTDVLDGSRRKLDVAFLLDDARPREQDLCERWRRALHTLAPTLRCPFNEPYHGRDDGLTTELRGRCAAADYLGIELEIRQGLIPDDAAQRRIADLLAESLRSLATAAEHPGD